MRQKLLFLLLCLGLGTTIVFAQIPETLTYQGALTDASGKALPDGSYNLTFKLYDAATGGAALWTEAQTVEVKSGVFDVILGSKTALTLAFDKQYWLGLTIGTGAELSPRTRLTATAYSMNARSISDNAVTGAKIAAGQVVKSVNGIKDDVNLTAGNNVTIDKTGNTLKISAQGGTSSGNGWTVAGDNVSTSISGNVGIGTAEPQNKLHVSGELTLGADPQPGVLYNNNGFIFRKGLNASNYADLMRITGDGKIGIGIAEPAEKLDIAGTVRATGLDLQFPALVSLGATDNAEEGAQIIWKGASNFSRWITDVYRDNFRFFVESNNEHTFEISNYGTGLANLSVEGNLHTGGRTFRLGTAFYNSANPSDRPIIASDGVHTDILPAQDDIGKIRIRDGNSPGAMIFENRGISTIDSYAGIDNNTVSSLVLQTNGGNVGIGITEPGGKLDVAGTIRATGLDIQFPALVSLGPTDNAEEGAQILWKGAGSYSSWITDVYRDNFRFFVASPDRYRFEISNYGTGLADLIVEGTTTTQVLTITGGADLAEPFVMSEAESIEPGAVVIIDEANPGQLKLSEKAYDTRVAGIISGAGGVNPGLTLSQEDQLGKGQNVALTGRVYAKATAVNGAIKPGDLLTTSDVPGHLMKATDRDRAYGSVLGKAMTGLETGEGLVLVLVNLQ